MNSQQTNSGIFRNAILILGILAGICLVGYAGINLIRMPAASPDAFVPRAIEPSESSPLGIFQFIFILGFSFAFLPVTVMFTIRRYKDNPPAMIIGGCLLCFALVIEVMNNLPFFGMYVYPEALAQIPSDVLLYLNQTTAIRYLALDVAGFTILYVSLLIYAIVYWKSRRIIGYLVIASMVIFTASAPFLWVSGQVAVILMAVSIMCLAPIPVFFGQMAAESAEEERLHMKGVPVSQPVSTLRTSDS